MILNKRTVITALGVVACAAVAAVAVVVADSDGYSTRHVDLGDGGVWTVSEHDGLVGRVNLSVGGLDATVAPPGASSQNAQLDLVQDAVGVVARDRAQGRIYPVDAADGTIDADNAVAVAPEAQVAIGGGTVAVLDPSTGRVWARRFDPAVGLANLTGIGGRAVPVATIGRSATGTGGQGAALAVGPDGAVHAVSAQGRLATVMPTPSGLGAARYRNLGVRLTSPQLTAVGPDTVVLDAATGALLLPGGRTATLPDRDPATELQQSGPGASTVVAATSRSLFAVDLDSGKVHTLGAGGTGTPAAPLVVGECAYLAWTGTPGRTVRSCGGADASVIALADEKALVQPQLRVNRGAVVVNDAVSGGVWQLPGGRRVDNWAAIKPPTKIKPKQRDDKTSDTVGTVAAPPHAVADNLGARPGRATTLHVLDNDSDPAGTILSITSATLTDSSGAQLDVAPDGQTVQVTMPSSASTVRFRYTVNDTKGLANSAPVVVTARPAGTEKPPNLRPGYRPRTVAVAAGGTLSLPVIGDWRDFDGDPPVLASAQASAGTTSTTPDGRIDYIAPLDGGTTTISYTVTDGIAATRATVNLTVLAVTSSQSTPAAAEPDVARGQVGQPIVVRPLDNDLPGADPTEPGARITLASAVPEPDGTSIVTDLGEGTVTVTADRAGTFVLTYLAAFGNAAYAKGSVRVDVSAATDRAARPVAVLDTATLHGQRPVIADVLTNDFDPAGRVLVVTSASAQDTDQLQVAIVQGKYLRINALSPELDPNPQVINYVITDGVSPSVTGQVSVDQLPEAANGTPVPQDDYGTVRAGDSVTVPVLDNDTDPNGDTLTLAPDVKGAPGPGRLTVSGTAGGAAGGEAYAAGTVVRYVAPTGVTTEREVTVDYVVRNGNGDQAVGQVFLTVTPPPSAARPDQQPTPPEIDRRVVAGDTVSIPIRTSLVDPDGDAVTLTGIGSGPQLGRVLEVTASALRYQAYPTSAGTDSFGYTVTDRFGKVGSAALRIAVVAPGDPQPPVASDITVSAAPGAAVTVDVLAQAYTSADDVVSIVPLAQTNSESIPGSATLLSTTGPIRLRANKDLRPVVLRYAIRNGLGEPSTATLRVRTVAGTDLPPIAADNVARPAAGKNAVTVDPLARATDPDAEPGAASTLRVTRVFDTAATVAANKVTLPVLDRPQIVPYEIADGGGAAATAVIFVPAQGAGAPTIRPGVRIDLDRNGTKSIDIASYAIDPAGKRLGLTTSDQISASPAAGLRVRQDGATGLVLTAQDGYIGPAAVTFQVTDGTSLTDPKGVFGVITVPVQIGPETPVLRCPSAALSVVEGGGPLDLDVSSLCHVWVADPATLGDIQYTASWTTDPGDISLSGFGTRTLHVAAAGGAQPNSVGTLKIGVVGKTVRAASLKIVVQASPPPSVSPVTVDGLVAGRSAVVDLADYVQSRLRDKAVSIVSVERASGLAATARPAGSRVTITPDPNAKGTIVFTVIVTDIADRTVARRQATGRITVHVLGKPDAPTGVAPGRTALSHVAVLSWQAPANNGEPIDFYRVTWDGGSRNCAASPCRITALRNAEPYRFVVVAHNAVGFGRPSAPSATVVPDEVPSAPTGLRTSDPQDHKLTVSWQPARVDGTPVLYYLLRWPGAAPRRATGTSATATGLDNDATTTFSVVAVNKQGAGAAATVRGQSSGSPQYPAPPADPRQPPAPTVDAESAGDRQHVRLSWPAVDPNGPGRSSYTVQRSAGGSPMQVCTTRARTCTDDVANDGTQYDYSYSATNGTGNRSTTSATGSFVARGTPEGIGGFQVVAGGQDGQAELRFDEQPVRDKRAVIHCRVESAGGRACPDIGIDGAGAHPDQRTTLNGLDDGPVTISLQQCNTVGQCAATVRASTVVYGQLTQPRIDNLHASGPNIDFTAVWNPHGGQVRVEVKVGKDDGTVVSDYTVPPGPADGQDHSQTFGDDVDKTLGTPISVTQFTHVNVTVTVTDASSLPNRGSPDAARGDVTTGGPIKVALTRGSTTCSPPKTTPKCGQIHLQLIGFQQGGQVVCSFSAQGGPTPATVTVPTDGNGGFDDDLPATYATAGAKLQVTCESVQDDYTWPG